MLYPNYRGYLFDDQSQTMNFDVQVNPPVGTVLSDWSVDASVIDESNQNVVLHKSFASAPDFPVTFNGSSLVDGNTYIVRFQLLRTIDGSVAYTYPPYRVSKVAGSVRASMSMSVNDKNQILFNGQPQFLLGVYDSSYDDTLNSSGDITGWDNYLTLTDRLYDLPINFYMNEWYNSAAPSAIQALVTALQAHGISDSLTNNCFSVWPSSYGLSSGTYPVYTDDSYLSGLAAISQLGGTYIMDECIPGLAALSLARVNRLKSFKPDGINWGTGGDAQNRMYYWRDVLDVVATDPYPIHSTEPALYQVADDTAAVKVTMQSSRPIVTVIQFFQATYSGGWPTQAELRDMSYMAIAEGANGLMYWSMGNSALARICTGVDAYHSPSSSAASPNPTWCQAKIDNFNNLKAVTTEIDSLQPALSSLDRNDLLAGNSNSGIHTRVKYANGNGYLIASNNTNATTTATFTWSQTPSLVNVYNESRSVILSGSSFTDTFAPYEAHVYEISTP